MTRAPVIARFEQMMKSGYFSELDHNSTGDCKQKATFDRLAKRFHVGDAWRSALIELAATANHYGVTLTSLASPMTITCFVFLITVL